MTFFKLLFQRVFLLGFIVTSLAGQSQQKWKVLLIDGQNNHDNWPKTSKLMIGYLEETGLFEVERSTTPAKGEAMDSFVPDFSKYDLVLSNYNGDSWPQSTRESFESWVRNGGAFVVVHAADNAFPEWEEYNKMIGLGGWGGRTEESGPYVYIDDHDKIVHDKSPGLGGGHGSQHDFVIKVRQPEHPVMNGMPLEWLHVKDELYATMRGPAENMEILATAYASPKERGTGRNEPMVMAIRYGKGKVFHTTLGHGEYSQKCIGFVTLLQRGAEWAISGKVTQGLPKKFPSIKRKASR